MNGLGPIWKCHRGKVVSKCEKVINILRSLSGSDWGAERDTLLLIYRAMIRSILDYGCVVFGSAAKSLLCNSDRVQAKALRVCCGAFRTTPIPALLVEMGELPLRISRHKLGIHYWSKLNGLINSSGGMYLLEDVWEFVVKERKSNLFHQIKQMARRMGLVQGRVGKNTWSPVPFWLLPEPV